MWPVTVALYSPGLNSFVISAFSLLASIIACSTALNNAFDDTVAPETVSIEVLCVFIISGIKVSNALSPNPAVSTWSSTEISSILESEIFTLTVTSPLWPFTVCE